MLYLLHTNVIYFIVDLIKQEGLIYDDDVVDPEFTTS